MSKPVEQIVNVLKSFLPTDLYALDFTTEQYKKLLATLQLSTNDKSFMLKRGTLIEGIVEYFKLTCQNISVKLSFDDCSITKHFIGNTTSESFDRIIHQNTLFLLEVATKRSEFQTLPNLVVLPQKIRDIAFQAYIDKKITFEKSRSLVRQQLRPVFNLEDRDVIFFLRSRIWIRYHAQPQKASNGIDNRFSGESVDVLKAMYNSYFTNDIWDEIESILDEILEDKLNFSSIDNVYFSKTFIQIFRGMIEILLIDLIKPDDREKIEGLTGYVLRQYFDKILLYCAKNLLDYVENRDRNAEEFIKSFTDATIIDGNGNKTQKYPIIDDKQQKWNYVSILSILMQYKQAKLKIIVQNRNIEAAKEKVIVCEVGIRSETNNQTDQERKIESIKKLVAESDLAYFTNKKNGHTLLLSSQAKRHEELLTAKKIEENELDIIKNRITNKLIELKRRRQRVTHEIKAYEVLMEQIKPILDTYERIAHGVAVALTKR